MNNEKLNLIRLLTGAAIFITGFILEIITKYDFFPLFLTAYIILGGDIVYRALKNIFKGQFFDENFLMSIATIGAFILGEFSEAAAVMLFYQAGEYFQDMAVRRSKKSITDLMDIRPDYANLKEGGNIVKVSPAAVRPGDIIVIKPGEKIPLDGIVIEGSSMLDTSALTGESVPRKAEIKSAVLSGCVNLNGLLTVEVTKTFGESTVSKIIDLVENASGKKAKTENFITRFARYYTPVVVILAFLLAVIPSLLLDGEWRTWTHRALVFLVISCPCALVLSIPMGFFAGLGRAAKNGILIKGGNFLEAFNQLDTVVFDKTGTLTRGVFKVTSMQNANGFNEKELLEFAALAESFSNHPIAVSIINEYGKDELKAKSASVSIDDYKEISGCGISVNMNGKIILAGNDKLMEKNNITFTKSQSTGTKIYISYNGLYAGCVVISDEIKKDSREAVSALKERGVRRTVMLSGDNPGIARVIAAEIGLDEAYGGLLPHEKVEMMEKINAKKNVNGKLAFVGDGINDAPVLAMADIGIAMGALGSDAAIEASDAVLMTDEPSKLAEAIDIARFTKKIVRQNIIFVLTVKTAFLVLGAFGAATMWEAVFADVGVSLLAVLNSMRILNKKI